VTLSLATLDVVTLPAPLVETGIALTIAYVALENLFFTRFDKRWLVSFLFGFVHGFGFANVLKDMHLPTSSLAASLLFFHVGVELAKYVSESQNGVSGEARGEALYLLGEKVQLLVDLMNLDATSHGKSLYADLLVRRLSEYGIRVTRAEANARYVYDQAAFQEYVRREPRGRRVAEAKFRVMAPAFYGSVGSDPAELVNSDVDQLRRAVGREEAFLKEHPRSENLKEVRFFLAMDYYRLFRHSPDRATAMKYERLA